MNPMLEFPTLPSMAQAGTAPGFSASAYLDDKGELLVFWRPAPDQPFPWQASPTPKGDA